MTNTGLSGISIIILSFERVTALKELLKSILNQKLDELNLELIICNNSPNITLSQTDSSDIAQLLNQFNDVTLINSNYNWHCKIRYTLATAAKYETILFLDDDLILIDPQFIQYMYDNFIQLRPADILSCHNKLFTDWNEDYCEAVLLNFKNPHLTEIVETDVCGPGICMFNQNILFNDAIQTMPPVCPDANDMGFSIIAALEHNSKNYFLPSYNKVIFHNDWKKNAFCTRPCHNTETFTLYKFLFNQGYKPVLQRLAENPAEGNSPAINVTNRLKRHYFPWNLEQRKKHAAKISVIIPVSDKTINMQNAIKTVLEQSYAAHEILIIGCEQEFDKNINGTSATQWIHSESENIIELLNTGIAQATGDFIFWLDASDALTSDALATLAATVRKHPAADIIFCDQNIVNEYGEMITTLTTPTMDDNNLLDSILQASPFPAPGVLIRKLVFEHFIGPYPEFSSISDYDHWISYAPNLTVRYINQPLYHYSNIDAGITNEDQNSFHAALLKTTLHRYGMKEVLPFLPWHEEEYALQHANIIMGKECRRWNDDSTAASWFLNSINASEKETAEYTQTPHDDVLESSDTPSECKPNVLFVAHNFPPHLFAGAENGIYSLAKALQCSGINITVLHKHLDKSIREPELRERVYNGINVIELAHNFNPDLAFQVSNTASEQLFKQVLETNTFDLIHFQHIYTMPFSFINIANRKGLPVCVTLRDFWYMCPRLYLFNKYTNEQCDGPDLDRCSKCVLCHSTADNIELLEVKTKLALRNQYVKDTLQRVDMIVAPSQHLLDGYQRHGFAMNKSIISPHGLPTVSRPDRTRKSNQLTFGYLGQIQKVKNIETLIAAFKQVDGEVVLNIHGKGPQAYVNEIQQLCDKDWRIKYHGPYTPANLPDILAKLDAVIVPSIEESFCFVVREALSAGVPVIAARSGAIPEIIQHEKNGLLFDTLNVDELRSILQSIVDDSSLLKRLDPHAIKIKTIEEDAAIWIERYESLLTEPTIQL